MNNIKKATPEQLISWLEVNFNDKNEPLQFKPIYTKEEIKKEIFQRLSEPEIAHLKRIKESAIDLMQWIEVEHRPPVKDAIEGGRMVNVRLHSLADLNSAIGSN